MIDSLRRFWLLCLAVALVIALELLGAIAAGQDCYITPDGRQVCTEPRADQNQNPAVVKLESRSPPADGVVTTKHGTGAVVAARWDARGGTLLVITCAHVLRRDYELTVRLHARQPQQIARPRIGATDGSMDFATVELRVERGEVAYIPWGAPPQRGQRVEWQGFSSAGYFRQFGQVLGHDGAYIRAAGSTREGTSGGPIIAPDSGLVGVLTEGLGPTPGRSTSIGGPGVQWIRSFLTRHGYGWAVGQQCSTVEAEPAAEIPPPTPPAPPLVPVEPASDCPQNCPGGCPGDCQRIALEEIRAEFTAIRAALRAELVAIEPPAEVDFSELADQVRAELPRLAVRYRDQVTGRTKNVYVDWANGEGLDLVDLAPAPVATGPKKGPQ